MAKFKIGDEVIVIRPYYNRYYSRGVTGIIYDISMLIKVEISIRIKETNTKFWAYEEEIELLTDTLKILYGK